MKPKTPPTAFARAVRAARGSYSQAQLATLLGVAPSTIYRIERGLAPSQDIEARLRKWARGLPELPAREVAAEG